WFEARRGRDAALAANTRAEQRREVALESLNRLVFDVQENLRGQPNTYALRRKILEGALEGLKRVIDDYDPAWDADRTLGTVYMTRAEVAQARGQIREAGKWCQQARQVFARLVAESGSVQAKRDLALAYTKWAEVSIRLEETKTALDYCVKSLT